MVKLPDREVECSRETHPEKIRCPKKCGDAIDARDADLHPENRGEQRNNFDAGEIWPAQAEEEE